MSSYQKIEKMTFYWATSRVSTLCKRTHQAIVLWNRPWYYRLNSGASGSVLLTWLYPTCSLAPSLLKMLLANQYCPMDAAATNHLPALQQSEHEMQLQQSSLKPVLYIEVYRCLHPVYISSLYTSTAWITKSVCVSACTNLHSHA